MADEFQMLEPPSPIASDYASFVLGWWVCAGCKCLG